MRPVMQILPSSTLWVGALLVVVLACQLLTTTATTACWQADTNLQPNFYAAQPIEAVTDRSGVNFGLTKTYYTEQVTRTTARLWRINVDGSQRELLACSNSTTFTCGRVINLLSQPTLIKLEDTRVKFLYWYDAGSQAILRLPLTGNGAAETVACKSGCGAKAASWMRTVTSIVVDPSGTTGGSVYWSDSVSGVISIVNLASASAPQVFVGPNSATRNRRAIGASQLQLDRQSVGGPWLYWAEKTAVVRAHLSLTGDLLVREVAAGNLFVIDARALGGAIYFSDSLKIWKSNLDGTSVQLLVCGNFRDCSNVPNGGTSNIAWIEFDATNSRLYWLDTGSNFNRFFSAPATGNDPVLLLASTNFASTGAWPSYSRLQNVRSISTDAGRASGFGATWSDGSGGRAMPIVFNLNFKTKRLMEVMYSHEQSPAPNMIGGPSGMDFLGFERPLGASNALVWSYAGRVVRASATGSCLFSTGATNVTQWICPSGCKNQNNNIGRPESLRFDQVSGKTFWIDGVRQAVLRANADGTNVEVLMCAFGCNRAVQDTRFVPTELVLSRTTGGAWLYVVESSVRRGVIWRLSLDGNTRIPIICRSGGCTTQDASLMGPQNLVSDDRGANAVLYFQDAGPARTIYRYNGDGTGRTVMVCATGCGATKSLGEGFLSTKLIGMTVVVNAQGQPYLYWADRVNRNIARMLLTGTPGANQVQGVVCQTQSGQNKCARVVAEIAQLHGFHVRTINSSAGAPMTVWFSFTNPSGVNKLSRQQVTGLHTTAGSVAAPQVLFCSGGCQQPYGRLEQGGIITTGNTNGTWYLYVANRFVGAPGCETNPWCPGEWSILRGPANGGSRLTEFVPNAKLVPAESSGGTATL